MSEDDKQSMESNFLYPPWLKTSLDMWSNMVQTKLDEGSKHQSAAGNRFLEQWQKNIKSFKSFTQSINDPESATAAAKVLTTLPEIILKMAQSGWEASFQIQKHIMEKAGKIGRHTEAYNFDNLDQEVFKAFTDIYDKELRQYFQVPQLGLTRFYQERFNEFWDKQNIFETTLAEFLSIIFLPVEKSFKVLEEKLETMAKEGNMPKEIKDSYAIWVKILEGHYMNLFKSKEYTEALHNTLQKMEDYILARNNCIQDIMQLFPIPTNKEMDELYKELHLLKKRVKELEKKIKKHDW